MMLLPPSPFYLRFMALADLDAVMEIEHLALPVPAQAAVYRHELTQNEMANYQVLVGKQTDGPDELIGYAGYWLMATEAHISVIAVHPGWRGRGLGELLLLNLLFDAYEKQALIATLEVRRSNIIAQKLYHKYGFAIAGERRRYYRKNREDALIMTVAILDDHYLHTLQQHCARLFTHLESAA